MPDYPVSALHPEVRLFLVKNRRFFGAGPFRLLSLLQKSQSLSDACKKMNLSYSKGLRIINNIEEELGIKVVVVVEQRRADHVNRSRERTTCPL